MTANQTEVLQPKRWLTIQDLESEYNFKYSYQRDLRRKKLIPFSKVGKQIRYDRALIDQWLEDNATAVAVGR